MAIPRVLFIDIETAPILANIWTLYDANAIWVERDTFLLCFAYKWAHEKSVHTRALPDYPDYKKNKTSDAHLVRELSQVLSTADVVVWHNGDRFDGPKIQSRMAVHGLPPPPPFKAIDTLKISRKHFKFDSNKLDHLGRYLGCGRKIQNMGADIWRRCIDGDPKAWAWMKKYNAQDVRLLSQVFEKLKAWSPNIDFRPYHPGGCPTCLSSNVQNRGVAVAKTRKYQRLHCQNCGRWFQGIPLSPSSGTITPGARLTPGPRARN